MIGPKVRKRRIELRLSLRALAEKVGVTASFLSQVERDLTKPSINTLRKIADVMDIPIFTLLDETKIDSPVLRKADRHQVQLSDRLAKYEVLSASLNKKMQVFLVRMPPSELNFATNFRLDTEECIYVLQGCLKIQLEDTIYEIGPEDSVYFDGKSLRFLKSAGEEELIFISSITPPTF